MNQFGKNIKINLFGESHGNCVGITIEGLPAGISFNMEMFYDILKKRQGGFEYTTPRCEKNEFEIISGYHKSHTTGAPLTIIIPNKNFNSTNYVEGVVRPGHADLTYNLKYYHYNDNRGGGSSSARLTAPLVLLLPICQAILNHYGFPDIKVFSVINKIGTHENPSSLSTLNLQDINQLIEIDNLFINHNFQEKVINEIITAKNNGDSIGGKVETTIIGVPLGVGEPFFSSVESIISHLLFSIPGVKAVEFGIGTAFAGMLGSASNDELEYNHQSINFLSNNTGGINGGISNGNDINFKTTFRPTPSIKLPLKSINTLTKENITVSTNGQHDPCIAIRGLHVINALALYAITDLLIERKKYE